MPAPTLEKAITNIQLKGFLFINLKDVRRHLASSPVTPKRRMKKCRARIRSIRKKSELNETITFDDNMHPT